MKTAVNIVVVIGLISLFVFRRRLPEEAFLVIPLLMIAVHALGLPRSGTFSLGRLFALTALIAVFSLVYRLGGKDSVMKLAIFSLPIVMAVDAPREERVKYWGMTALLIASLAYVEIVSWWRFGS